MAPKYSPRRRRVYKTGERINRLEIFERDRWVCGICEGLIDKTIRLPNLMAATLDHVVPLAIGGQHTRDNVQAAHALCNFTKGCDSDWTEFSF